METLSNFDAFLEFLINSPVVPWKYAEYRIYFLSVFKAILIDRPQELFDNGSLQNVESVVRKVVESILSRFDLNNMNEFMALQLCWQLDKFVFKLDGLVFMSYEIYEEIRKPDASYYPKTTPFVFIHHLLDNFDDLLKDPDMKTCPFNYLILRVQKELQFWYSDLIEISTNPPLFLKETIQTITKSAYDAEYVVDSFLVGDLPSWHCLIWLYYILQDLCGIEQERRTFEDEVEDLKAKKTLIKDMLLGKGGGGGGDQEQLNLITIVGQRGIGKKAFVKELYNSPDVIAHFDSRMWFDSGMWDNSSMWRDYDRLTDKSLQGQRYLVVIDTVWYIDEWVEELISLPDSHNGSRIVLITQNSGYAFTATSKSISPPQNDKIWESLFPKVSCPSEILEQVGIKIAKRCKPESLPRVLVLLLQMIKKTEKEWEEVAQTLGSRVFGLKGSQEKRILDLTCIYLPDHLRACFFYMGVLFPHKRMSTYDEDEFSVSKLIRIWIAEGFVKQTASQTLESTAEDYVADLMPKNLLLPGKEKTLGGIKTYRLTHVVREFLESKVKEDNFLEVIHSHHSPMIYHQRCIFVSKWDYFVGLPYGPFVRSLFFSDSGYISHDIMSLIYNKFKFLRILNFGSIRIGGESFIEIGVLVLLRYLVIRSSLNFIPPSIANLQNLETFLFHQSEYEVVKVPDCIWDLSKLRHFHITPSYYHSSSSFDLNPHRLENSSPILENLQTFSRPTLTYGDDDMEKMLRRLTSIRKLSCVFLDSWDDASKCNRFPVLDFLIQLISLKVEYKRRAVKYPCVFNFPSNLKKLTLLHFNMPLNEISKAVMMLCNLEVLKLIHNDSSKRWEMEDDVVFPKLKYLKLYRMDVLEYWSATHNHFPHLEHLVVKLCLKLVEIPKDFAYISSLRMIGVKRQCTPSANESVKLIQEEHVKCWGHDELKIF